MRSFCRGGDEKIFYGWIIALCAFISAQTYGFFFSLGIFFKPLQDEFGWGAGEISIIHSFHIAVFIVSMPIVGRLADRHGIKKIFVISAFLMGIGFFLCGMVDKLWHFYMAYLIASLGVAATTGLPTTIVQRWFVKKKGLALGIAASGIGAGPLLAAPLSEYLISLYGWRVSYFIIGGLVWIIIMLVAIAIVDKPEDINLRPLGEEEPHGSPTMDGNGQIDLSHNPSARPKKKEWTARDAMRTRAFFTLGIIWLLCAIPIHLIMIHIVNFAINAGIPKETAAAGLGFIGGVSIAGRLLGGAFADIMGLKRSLIIATLLSSGMLIWLPFINTTNAFYAFVIIYGFLYGARVPQIPGLIGNYFGNKNLAEIMGLLWAVAAIGSIIGSLMGGFIFDSTGGYFLAFLLASLCFGTAGLLVFFLKTPIPFKDLKIKKEQI